jgi:hypothetical protein
VGLLVPLPYIITASKAKRNHEKNPHHNLNNPVRPATICPAAAGKFALKLSTNWEMQSAVTDPAGADKILLTKI